MEFMPGPPASAALPGFTSPAGPQSVSPPQPPQPPWRGRSPPPSGGHALQQGGQGATSPSASQQGPLKWGQTNPYLNPSWVCIDCNTAYDNSFHCQCWQQWSHSFNSQPIGARQNGKQRQRRNQSRGLQQQAHQQASQQQQQQQQQRSHQQQQQQQQTQHSQQHHFAAQQQQWGGQQQPNPQQPPYQPQAQQPAYQQQYFQQENLRTDILYDNDSTTHQLRVPTLPQHLASHLNVDYHPLSDGVTSDTGEFDDDPEPLLPTESIEKLKAERLALSDAMKAYAPFRSEDANTYTTNPLEEFSQTRIRAIDRKLAFRATPLQRIKQHTACVQQYTGKLNEIESQIQSLSKEYHHTYSKLTSSNRSLERARHASLKQLTGKQKVEQFAAIGATFCDDLTQGLATQEADTFNAALKECLDKVKLLIVEKEAADQATAASATPIQSPRQSPAPAATRATGPSGPRMGTPPDNLSTPLSTSSFHRTSVPEFGSRLPATSPTGPPAASASRTQSPTVTKEAAEQHAALLAQQVQRQADAEMASFKEQAKQQVASKMANIEQIQAEKQLIEQTAERRVAALLQEGTELQGRAAGLVQQQQQDKEAITRQTLLLQEQEAHTKDIQAKLDHLQAQHALTVASQGAEQAQNQAQISAQLVEFESTIRGRLNQEATAETQRVHQIAQQHVDQQKLESDRALAVQQEESRKLHEELGRIQEGARMRECENEHLRNRLLAAEAKQQESQTQLLQPLVGQLAAQPTQVDEPSPQDPTPEPDVTGARARDFSPFPVVKDPPDLGPEFLEPEDNEELKFQPPKKRASTTSPSPVAAIADHVYPPAFHGAAGGHSDHSPTSVPIKRGRGVLSPPREKSTRAPVASPLAATSKAEFFAANFHKHADSPLQDHSTSVKRNKAAGEDAAPGEAIPQDLAPQFEEVQINAFPH